MNSVTAPAADGYPALVSADTFITTNTAIELLPLTIVPPASQHAPSVYVSSLSTHSSRRAMRSAIEHMAYLLTDGRCDVWTLPWGSLRYEHTSALRAMLIELQEPATVRRKLSALKGVLKAAWRLRQIETEDYHRAVDLPPVKGETLLAGRMLSAGELRALVDACVADPTPAGARDAALLATLAGVGLRRSEAVALDISDYKTESGEITVRHGKGNKARVNYAGGGAADALECWIERRGDTAGPLFLPTTKQGGLVLRRLNDQAVMDILVKRSSDAGISHCSPHDLRRTYISMLLAAGIDINTVAKMVGHANIATTGRYDRRGEEEKQKAAGVLHFPFVRPPRTGTLDLGNGRRRRRR